TFGAAADDMQSNAMQLRMGENRNGIKSILFTLVNKEPNPLFAPDVKGHIFYYTCTRTVETVTRTCPDSGENVTLSCNGIAGTAAQMCKRPAPQCSLFDATSLSFASSSASGCKTVGFTEEYITCSCEIESRRRLA